MRVAINYAAEKDVEDIKVEPFGGSFHFSCSKPDFNIVLTRGEAIATYMELDRALMESDPEWNKHLKEVYLKEREVTVEDNQPV